jgi:pantoate kinase
MEIARAFAPCHITGFFQIFDQTADALHVGSKGAGVSLTRGVKTTVKIKEASKNALTVKINGSCSNSAEVSRHVANVFLSHFKERDRFDITVDHFVDVPIGSGFGASGAAALSLALSLNRVFGLGMSNIEAAQLAHTAEVYCKTGLGTVIAETFGGLEIRLKPGAPGIGEIKNVVIPEDAMVACLVFGPLSTKRFLNDEQVRKRVNKFGGKLVDELLQEPNSINFMKLSREFAENIGLITDRTRKVLEAADRIGFTCSMPIFGEAVFTLTEKGSVEELLGVFREHGSDGKIVVSEIDRLGARSLE